jgi:hypothetical protein
MYLPKHPFIFLLSLCLSLFSNISYSQTRQDFVGDWKIIKVELSRTADEEEKQRVEMISTIFLKSTFHFKTNNSFSFECPNKELAIKDGVWQFDINKKYLNITEQTTKGTPGQLMGIVVKPSGQQYLFLLEETPIILTVAKKN